MAAAYNGADWADRMLASPETVAAYKQWEQQVQGQKSDLEKWSAEQGRQLGRQALQKVDLYALAAWQILVLRNHKEVVDDAAFAGKAGLEPYFLSRWVHRLQNFKDEPGLVAFRAAATDATAAAAPEGGMVAVPDALQAQAQDLKTQAAAAAGEPRSKRATGRYGGRKNRRLRPPSTRRF